MKDKMYSRNSSNRSSRFSRDSDRRPHGRNFHDRPSRPSFKRDSYDKDDRNNEDVAVEVTVKEPQEERIAKVIARAGIASRRDAEVMIEEGRVTLNGEVLTSPAMNVTPTDIITVDGEPLPEKERTRLWIFHKPPGLVTTARDPQGRSTVFDHLPEELPRVVTVGRLDINTEGLLLLTNDGGLARVIAHPTTGWLRRYKVRAYGNVTQSDLDQLKDGIEIDEIEYGPIDARLDRQQGDNVWISMGLREGKNREVKKILEHLGLQVNRLIRLSFGPFQLGDIEPGLVEEVKTRVLKEQLGEALAQEAGVDFVSPVREPIAPFGSEKRHNQERDRDARPRSFSRDRFDDRSRDSRRDSYSSRSRDDYGSSSGRFSRQDREFSNERPEREERPRRPFPGERPASTWRTEDVEAQLPKGRKIPRRGADPKQEREERLHRERETLGSVQSVTGQEVVIERLKPETREPFTRSKDDRSFSGKREGSRGFSGDRGGRRDFGDKREGGRSFGGDRGGRRDFGDKREGGRSFGGDRGGRRDFGDKREGGRSFGGDRSGRRDFGDKREGGRSFDGDRGGRRDFGDKREGGRSFGGDRGGRRDFGDKREGSRSFGGDRGGRRDFGDKREGGRSFGGDRGGRRDFGDKREGGRSFDGDRGGRRDFGDKREGGRSFSGDRGGRRDFGDKREGGRSFSGDRGGRRDFGDKREGGRSFSGDRGGRRDFGDKREGGRSFSGDRGGRRDGERFHSSSDRKPMDEKGPKSF